MFVRSVIAVGVLVAVSVWQVASAEPVVLAAPITQFAADALGGIRTVVRYGVAPSAMLDALSPAQRSILAQTIMMQEGGPTHGHESAAPTVGAPRGR